MRPFSRPAPYGRIHRRFEAESARVGMFVACVRACVRACVCTHAYSRDEERGRTGGWRLVDSPFAYNRTQRTTCNTHTRTHKWRRSICRASRSLTQSSRSCSNAQPSSTVSTTPVRCAAPLHSLGTRVSAQRRTRKCLTRRPTLLACGVAIPRGRLQACRVSARRARGRCAFAAEVRCAGYYFESAALKSAERQTIARRFAAQALMHP